MFGYIKKYLLDDEIAKNTELVSKLNKIESEKTQIQINLKDEIAKNTELVGKLNKVEAEKTQIQINLKDEIAKNAELAGKSNKVEAEKTQVQINLKDLEIRYSELISSEQYTLLKNIDSLNSQLESLRNQVKTEKDLLDEIKNIEFKKAKSEIDAQFEKLKTQAKNELEDLNKKLKSEELSIRLDLDNLRVEFTKKHDELTQIDAQLKAKHDELNSIQYSIDIQDELNTIKTVSQVLTGMNSAEIKDRLKENKDKQKTDIKEGKAWKAYEHYYLNNSLSDGKAQQKRLGKFLLTAFNAETDNIISMVKKGNFNISHKNIEKWFEKINKLGEDHQIVIERNFLKHRLEELRIVVEYHIQKEFEKEEERYINDCIREEKRVQKEIETFVIAREKEEKDYIRAINQATEQLKANSDAEMSKLNVLIKDLQTKLERSIKEKERAMSLAQLTRSGHVYIISNKGSFGPDVYKIGMTRRLDPMDRVRELGDASVPFFFDVHGMIHSEDAPSLEKELHRRFDKNRVNKDNYRREFFKINIEDIEKAICEIHGHVSLDYLTENNN